MKRPVQLKHELFIIFNTFYLFLIDKTVMYLAKPRIFHTSLIQTSLILQFKYTGYYLILTGNQIKTSEMY